MDPAKRVLLLHLPAHIVVIGGLMFGLWFFAFEQPRVAAAKKELQHVAERERTAQWERMAADQRAAQDKVWQETKANSSEMQTQSRAKPDATNSVDALFREH